MDKLLLHPVTEADLTAIQKLTPTLDCGAALLYPLSSALQFLEPFREILSSIGSVFLFNKFLS